MDDHLSKTMKRTLKPGNVASVRNSTGILEANTNIAQGADLFNMPPN